MTRFSTMHVTAAGCLALLLLSTPAAAQSGVPHALTFRGAPAEVTRGFLITEFGVATRLNGRRSSYVVSHATWDVGYMRNVGERWALGATLFLSTDDHYYEAYFIGLKPRFRYWVARRLHADLSLGALLAQRNTKGQDYLGSTALVGHAGIGYGDWGSIVVQFESVHYTFAYAASGQPLSGRETNWYLGANLGSYPGAVMAPLALAAVIFVRNLDWD